MLKIAKALLATDINAYSDAGDERKNKFHSEGKKFLRALAKEIGVEGECDIRSNLGGIAVSGEVTLHADHVYIQLSESCVGDSGVSILHRACEGRKDYCGKQNRNVMMKSLASDEETLERFISTCRRLASAEVTV